MQVMQGLCSCSVDLSAALLVLCFYYDVYISSYAEQLSISA